MDIRSMNLEEMEALAISLGEKAFRGKQLFQWVHEKQADDFDESECCFSGKIKRELLHIRCETGGKTGVEKRRYGKVFICTGR